MENWEEVYKKMTDTMFIVESDVVAIKSFIRELVAAKEKEARKKLIDDVESTIAEFGDQGIGCVAGILQESFHGQREIEY